MHFVFQRKPYHRQSAQLCDKNLVNQCQYLLGQHAQQTPRYNSPHDTAQGLCMSKAPSTRVGTVCAWRVTLRPQRAVCDAFAARTTEPASLVPREQSHPSPRPRRPCPTLPQEYNDPPVVIMQLWLHPANGGW